ncbi:MAG TPA: carboxylating nicotinate-nucleotide diphosphorylase [Acidimicrobiia bacterium]|nr:carboxylating nicotinate-nucleotide diphosphorylase [Acidimicrobiia bacterium]
MSLEPPPETVWRPLLERALDEDLADAGDITTDAVVPDHATATGNIVAREAGVVAGLGISTTTFGLLDDAVVVDMTVGDGDRVSAGDTLAVVSGPARAILTGERVTLNLLGRMCGIATRTAQVVAAVAGTTAVIAATRKTTPGLRALEKYAVRCGGGTTHRFGLYDAVLIKDNHLVVAGSVTAAVAVARAAVGHLTTVEVEVTDLDQLDEALAAGADVILLDNMSLETMRAAVERTGGRAVLEASGGITPDTVAAVAATGVDVISLGWLTHSAPALDVALDLVEAR